MMSDETITMSSIQYVMGGDLESVRSALIKSLMMNSIPFSQGNNGESARLDPADVFHLYSPRWLAVGRIELESVDLSQVLLRFCLPTFPSEAEVEIHEECYPRCTSTTSGCRPHHGCRRRPGQSAGISCTLSASISYPMPAGNPVRAAKHAWG